LLDELNVSRATVVGLSMGATIALEFALIHPERVERLVLVSPGIPGIRVNADMEWMKPIAEAVRRGNPRRAAELWWESPILAGVPQLGARADRYRAIVLENAGIWTVPRRPPPLVPPAGTRLQEIAMPVLAVAGDRDRSGSVETAQRLASSVQRGRLHIISGAGHMLSLERPDDVARLVLEAAGNRATER
jgi:pimeloyl-ACP methyl ester carboxylesterase